MNATILLALHKNSALKQRMKLLSKSLDVEAKEQPLAAKALKVSSAKAAQSLRLAQRFVRAAGGFAVRIVELPAVPVRVEAGHSLGDERVLARGEDPLAVLEHPAASGEAAARQALLDLFKAGRLACLLAGACLATPQRNALGPRPWRKPRRKRPHPGRTRTPCPSSPPPWW